ncbi:M3 family oligoendopeptidase [Weissella diestrammenae]|uniref:M3 family oligoendopeptidase n=1 Tax=Weissella diestrammenae TaxID=1162633 RepID=A0A7G9T6W5_9LACO|nr:M3 family oligoendopeptidase [Weissella diestrammenae]MCM0582567.1 M3 family oligoendopeptidase [Weissella diestrammenae]QNN75840.1 M3 family oligoendopeptidase [Weissella diestrammenae]
MTYSLNWDLDAIFPGGIHSPALKKKLALLQQQIDSFSHAVRQYQLSDETENYTKLAQLTEDYQTILAGHLTVDLFVNAHFAADFTNAIYRPYMSQVESLAVALNEPENGLKKILATFDTSVFEQIMQLPAFTDISFALKELRREAQRLLDDQTEEVMAKLAVDGIHAWSAHYETLAGTLSLTFTDENNHEQTISAGQALNQLDGYPNAQVRRRIMQAYEVMWGQAENLAADSLNHIAGARLTMQKAHGFNDYLSEPLMLNRMSKKTLETMWQVVDANKTMFKPFFERKAQLLGLDGIAWQDQVAPITTLGDYTPTELSYDAAAQLIIQNFKQYSPKMADFAAHAFEHRWIEAENRPGKQPGGWMESVPDIHESRIFLTFTGSVNDAATIAHELGHGFHSSVLTDLPPLRDQYAMNVAETASTFAELVVNDASVSAAKSDAEKVVLLDAKMANPVAMFLNIHARFEFENAFYQERAKGYVTADRLNTLMSAAQEDAFAGVLTEKHPHFWASKLHFYGDTVPFYNFPYTFGYLFSAGIYAWAQEQPDFETAYIALLRDTAAMSTEELAQQHLGVDLTQPDFWQAGADMVKKDIQNYLALSAQFV